MRILCLHGVGANGQILQTMLAPVIYALRDCDDVQFYFVNGPTECEPAMGMADLYDGPFYRFFDLDTPHVKDVRKFQRNLASSVTTASPEAAARNLYGLGLAKLQSSRACDFVEQHIERCAEGPFDALLGFSEGASVAASLILRRAAQGKETFKLAIFICAGMAFGYDSAGPLLADETSTRINLPSVHIIGAKDPGRQLSMTLYNLCDLSSASLWDHGKGHTVPWGPSTSELAREIRGGIHRSRPSTNL